MGKILLTLILIFVYICVTVDCLKCYVCNDCKKVKDASLMSCDVSTSISTTTLPTTTAPTSNASTTNSNITTLSNTTIVTNSTTPMAPASTSISTATTPTTSAPNQTIVTNSSKVPVPRLRREVLENNFNELQVMPGYKALNTTLVYYCFKSTVKVNTTEKIVRGCASRPDISNRTICNDMTSETTVTSCLTCTTDKCNSAFTTQISVLLLIITITLSLH